jgi:hypothetical protein
MQIKCCTNDNILEDVKPHTAAGLQSGQHALGLRHDFRADAVAGKDKEGFVGDRGDLCFA